MNNGDPTIERDERALDREHQRRLTRQTLIISIVGVLISAGLATAGITYQVHEARDDSTSAQRAAEDEAQTVFLRSQRRAAYSHLFQNENALTRSEAAWRAAMSRARTHHFHRFEGMFAKQGEKVTDAKRKEFEAFSSLKVIASNATYCAVAPLVGAHTRYDRRLARNANRFARGGNENLASEEDDANEVTDLSRSFLRLARSELLPNASPTHDVDLDCDSQSPGA